MEQQPIEDILVRRASIAAAIRAELGYQDISRAALAEATGIKLDTLRRRLNGVRPFLYEELDAISCALGVDLADLVSRGRAA